MRWLYEIDIVNVFDRVTTQQENVQLGEAIKLVAIQVVELIILEI